MKTQQTKTQATAGPWMVEKLGFSGISVNTEWRDANGFKNKICEVSQRFICSESTIEANARLIAAAPDMLAALNMVLDAGTNDGEEKSAAEVCRLIDWGMLRTVLAKAENR